MGFTDFRVRTVNEHARLEVTEDQWMKVAEKKEEIYSYLKGFGYEGDETNLKLKKL